MNHNVKFSITSDPVEALTNANYIITTIRVGEEESRVKDERVALKHGGFRTRNNRTRRFCLFS